MNHCPSPECPTFIWRKRHPEFVDSVQHCDVCGADLVAGLAPDNASTHLSCPDCHCNMNILRRSGVCLDRCSQCAQVWFDMFELDRILRSRLSTDARFTIYDLPFKPDRDSALSVCPRCNRDTLRHGRTGEIRVRSCDFCRGFLIEEPLIQSVALRATSAFAKPRNSVILISALLEAE